MNNKNNPEAQLIQICVNRFRVQTYTQKFLVNSKI